MPLIHLTTFIAAPQERVFDLSRSVELHKNSMKKYEEKILNGTMAGLMQLNDTVTWSARHLFKERILKVKVSQFQPPYSFTDEQVEGDFISMKHEHFFKPCDNGTIMIDLFHYEVPHGLFGKLVNGLYLEKYMTRLLQERNNIIKEVAETGKWKQVLIK